jgi:hypothetical protein
MIVVAEDAAFGIFEPRARSPLNLNTVRKLSAQDPELGQLIFHSRYPVTLLDALIRNASDPRSTARTMTLSDRSQNGRSKKGISHWFHVHFRQRL